MDINFRKLQEKLPFLVGREKIDMLNLIARYPTYVSPKEALEFANEALRLSEMIYYEDGIAHSFKNIAVALTYLGDCEKSIDYSLKALEIFEKKSNDTEIANTLINLGSAYGSLSDYDKAIDFYFKALRYEEKIENIDEAGNCLRRIGIIYWCMEDYENALNFCKRALPIHEKSNNYAGTASASITIGLVYKHFGDYEKAIINYNRAYDIAINYNIKDVEAAALINLGYIYAQKNNYDKALEYYNKSLEIHMIIDYKAGIATNLLYLGNLFLALENHCTAIHYLDKALIIAKEVKIKKIINEVYLALSNYYECIQDYNKALQYFKLHSSVKDSIFTEKIRNAVTSIQNKYEIENAEKEKEIYRLKNVELAKVNEALVLANEQINKKNEDLLATYKKLELMAQKDYLTKLWNRSYMLEKIDEERNKFKLYGKNFVIIIADIDYFKKFNDKYGHDCGDFVLTSISSDMSSLIRKSDYVARWGGEEFLILLPETSLSEGYIISERIRENISNKIYIYNNLKLSVTLTLGICEYSKETNIQDCINLADEALYRGKKTTKNCVITALG